MKLKIRTKLLVGFLKICIIILISGIFSYQIINYIEKENWNVGVRDAMIVDACFEVKYNMTEARRRLEEIMNGTEDREEANQVFGLIEDTGAYIDAILSGGTIGEDVYYATDNEEIRNVVQDLGESLVEFQNAAKNRSQNFENNMSNVNINKNSNNVKNQFAQTFNLLIQKATEAEQLAQQNMRNGLSTVGKYASIGKIGIIIATGLTFIVAVFIGIFLASNISKPINRTNNMLRDISEGEGDLTKELHVNSKDEIGEFSRSFNIFINKIKEIIVEVKDKANIISETSQELSATTQEISAQSQNASASTQQIASGMESSSASIEEINVSVQEIAESSRQLAKKAEDGNDYAIEVGKRARKMKDDAQKSKEVSEAMYSEKHDNILKAIKKSMVVNEIENMSNQISKISEQINLLALNAAIEAARAGAHGNGFAVVAEEVRKLAEESSITVSSIQTVVKDVQDAFEDLSKNSSEILTFIDEKVSPDYEIFVNSGIQYMNDSNVMSTLVGDFAATSEQILASIEQVSEAIDSISSTLEQASTGSQDINLNVQEVAIAVEDAAKITEKQMDLSQQLYSLVQKFKV